MAAELANVIKLQQVASNPRNSAWVFASAGSGKTKVLTDRVLRLLLDGVSPHKILCLTFTKTAAAEMQHRINVRLAEWVILDDDLLVKKIAELIGENPTELVLKKARILFAKILDSDAQIKVQTIHAFCQNLVKIFPFEIGVKPNFEVMDGNLEKLFLQKARQEVLAEALIDKGLQHSVTQINSKLNEESFLELIGKILSQKERLIFLKNELFGIENIIAEIFKNFAVSADENEQRIFDKFVDKVDFIEILNIAESLANSKTKTNQKTAIGLKKFAQQSQLKNFSNYQEIFFTKAGEAKKISSIVTKEFLDHTPAIEAQQALIANFLEHLNSYKIAQGTALLLRFVDKILEKYSQLKNRHSFLDYNDLIIKSEKMLYSHDSSDWIKFRMDGFFDHILVDESQDTNHRQWSIIKALTEDFFSGQSAQNKNRTIFIIGDDKQSIYSFQGSEPNISHEIYGYYQEKLQENPLQLHKVDLLNSFRSLPEILQAVDAVFSNTKHLGSVDYQGHKAIRQGVGKVEIWPQIRVKKTKAEKSFAWQEISAEIHDEEYSAKEFLTEMIALKIQNWVGQQRAIVDSKAVADPKASANSKASSSEKSRIVNYGDIMILLRNRTNGFDKILQQKLREKNIPFKGEKRSNFSSELIVQDLLAAARFALLPQDDLNLAALLKSPIFAISEEELFEICVVKNEKKISLFEALRLCSSKFGEVLDKLENLIKNARLLNCFEFFTALLTTKLRQKLLQEFGDKALPILDQFTIKLFDFSKNNLPNLQNFLDFVEKIDPEISLTLPPDNRVTITTIHSAKGLQAPIVILPDCCFNFNQMMAAKENFFWMNFSINEKAQKLPIWCAKKSEENSLVKAYKKHKIQEAKEEYFRLLYVAMTRAEDELYIMGFGDAASEDSWYKIIKNSLEKLTKNTSFSASLKSEEVKFFEKTVEKFDIEDIMLCLGK